jgi:hypothetical protein
MAHTAPAAPCVLHRTRIGKAAMKKLEIDCQWQNKLFWIVIFHFSIGKAKINAPRLWKECLTASWHWPGRNGVCCSFFNC